MNLTLLAVYIDSDTEIASRYWRMQRFFSQVCFNYDDIARLIINMFAFSGQSYYLTLDRTNWKWANPTSTSWRWRWFIAVQRSPFIGWCWTNAVILINAPDGSANHTSVTLSEHHSAWNLGKSQARDFVPLSTSIHGDGGRTYAAQAIFF